MAIEAVVARMWPGSDIRVSAIAAGLTNQNFRVEVDGTPFFVRLPGASTDLLAVDRANELHNTRAAAEAGVGPKVVAVDSASGAFALEWIEGRTMSNAAFVEPGTPARIAEALRRLHSGPRFRDDFDMVRLSAYYLRVADERSLRIPDGYREHMAAIPRIDAALAAHPLQTVPCHNDLLAENYLDDGARLWIVDYEYSGNNDPTFELGNTAQELQLDAGRQQELCAAYFGPDRFAREGHALLARMRLQMIMSDVGWTLWAAIQAAISRIDYDFWGWALERWGRASVAIDRADFEALLDAASAGDA
ncbi:MAG TPA: choline/ethanolamine kinase family protein [Candidatus Dormibacteraeota bacterium]|nr:choline/ethanolamine kinase family protein [Candidatus Dormibacteraeota bacterium]